MTTTTMTECRGACVPSTVTVEELERRAVVQKNDLVLHEAVIKNDADAVRRVLREPVEINSRNNVSGATARATARVAGKGGDLKWRMGLGFGV